MGKLCSYLRTGVIIGYNIPLIARFSNNLPTAIAQPEIVTESLTKEVSLGRVAGPFSTPPFANLQVSPYRLSIQEAFLLSLEPYFTSPFQSLGLQASITQSFSRTIACNILLLTILSKEFSVTAEAVFLPKLILSLVFDLFH